MLKTGIYSIEKLKNARPRDLLGFLKNVTITLYDQILHEPNFEELQEKVLLLFSDNRGAYKRTYKDRFSSFEPTITGHIQAHFPIDCPLTIHDVGISNGMTSLDFFRQLDCLYPHLRFIGSDYEPFVEIVEKDSIKVVRSKDKKILEILLPPFVLNTMNPDWTIIYPINRLLSLCLRRYFDKNLDRLIQGEKWTRRELCLFSSSAVKEAEANLHFKLRQHDILVPFEEKNHIIRAMNILNKTYFTTAQFDKVLTHIHTSLEEGGLFITGSNQDAGSQLNGGIYQKQGSRFVKIENFGEGSMIEDLILGKQVQGD